MFLLEVKEGEFEIALVGPNGAGKTNDPSGDFQHNHTYKKEEVIFDRT